MLAGVSPAPLAARLLAARVRLKGETGRMDAVSLSAALRWGYARVTEPLGYPLARAAAVGAGPCLHRRFPDAEAGTAADGSGQPERQRRLAP